MEPKIIEQAFKKVKESMKETQTLYELTESDVIVLTLILENLPNHISGKLMGRLLRATAHLVERNDDIARELVDLLKKE